MRHRLERLLQALLEDVAAALLPAACRTCGAELPRRLAAAPRSVRPWSALYTGALRRPLAGPWTLPLVFLCPACCGGLQRAAGAAPLPGDRPVPCIAAFEPSPVLFELVHAFKYERAVELAPWLGIWMAEALRRDLPRRAGARLVPVPLHPRRQAQRGYNQSLLLAAAVGRRLGLPVHDGLLQRRRATAPQATLGRGSRQRNVERAFARPAALPPGTGAWVLVDDVVTTGATAGAALAALGAEPAATRVLTLCRAHPDEPPRPPRGEPGS
jgi:ComF family protein